MAGRLWPWKDGRTIATVVVFGVLVGIFALQQYFAIFRTAETRAFPIHLLTFRSQLLLYIATPANITALWVVVFFHTGLFSIRSQRQRYHGRSASPVLRYHSDYIQISRRSFIVSRTLLHADIYRIRYTYHAVAARLVMDATGMIVMSNRIVLVLTK